MHQWNRTHTIHSHPHVQTMEFTRPRHLLCQIPVTVWWNNALNHPKAWLASSPTLSHLLPVTKVQAEVILGLDRDANHQLTNQYQYWYCCPTYSEGTFTSTWFCLKLELLHRYHKTPLSWKWGNWDTVETNLFSYLPGFGEEEKTKRAEPNKDTTYFFAGNHRGGTKN